MIDFRIVTGAANLSHLAWMRVTGKMSVSETCELVRPYKLIGALDKEAERILKLRQKRERAPIRTVSLADRVLRYKTDRYLSAYSRCGFRRCHGRWAGGNHALDVRIRKSDEPPKAASSTEKVWSGNGKWSGFDSSHELIIGREVLDLPVDALVRTRKGRMQLLLGRYHGRVFWAAQGPGTRLKVETEDEAV
jgi:hypothetical protein